MPLFHERSGVFSREKTAFLLLAVLPAAWLAGLWLSAGLGPRPLSEAIHFTGLWTIRFLVLTLAITPARRLFAAPKLFFGRRILGLAALAYGLTHLILFIADQGAARAAAEIALRVYLTIGAAGVALLVLLGATSSDGAIRRLGQRRWAMLHRAVYVIALLGAVHFFMQSKLDVTEPVLVSGILVLLFLYRIAFKMWGEVTPGLFALLSVGAGVLTAGLEMAWYGLATRVDPWLVGEANLSFDLGPRPAWWVLAVGLAVACLAALRQWRMPRRGRRASIQAG